MSFLDKLFGDFNKKALKKISPIVEKINSFEQDIEKLSDDDLRNKTQEFKDRLAKGETLDDILPEAFAVVRETSKRVIGQRHYDVQLTGGIVLHQGKISEMKTGEGKTLTATLPVYLNALSDKGVHVVTVNDYLARRDASWMGQVYNFLGLTVGCVQNQMITYIYDSTVKADEADNEEELQKTFKVDMDNLRPVQNRREAYQCDIVYGTNNEFGFDYLRDNMVMDLDEMTQRELNFAIIDEVDSILIDEARTPLIISGPAEAATEKYYKFAGLVRNLEENKHFNIDEKARSVTLTEEGILKVEELLGIGNIYVEGGISTVHHVEQALRALTLFKRDKEYVIQNDEILIVDEFTGRLMPGRRFSEGLHQAIEAKENVKIQRESQTLATITFQNLFRMYSKLSGMTGTAMTEQEEFFKIYGLEAIAVPTNRPNIRKDLPDRIYSSEDGKMKAVVKEVKELQAKGQPVLLGTISVEKNEMMSEYLERGGVDFQVLNAKNHEKEAQIIAQAGKPGAVTLATNMAGRGVDIILGGNPTDSELAKKVKDLGGLHVIGTERHESRRIDNQLRGRSGRQGDPGATQFYISMEDDLLRIFGSDRMKNIMKSLKVPEDMPIENGIISKSIESAQKRVEGYNFDVRKHLVEYDDVMNKQREVIYKKRKRILEASKQENAHEKLKEMVLDSIKNEINVTVNFHTVGETKSEWNKEEILQSMKSLYDLKPEEENQIKEILEKEIAPEEIRKQLVDALENLAVEKYKVDVEGRLENNEVFLVEVEKGLLLRAIDVFWIEHLEMIGYLRTGIGLRGYGQRDPLVEYKREAFQLFNQLLESIDKQIAFSIYKIGMAQNLAPGILQQTEKRYQGAGKEGDTAVSAFNKDQQKKAATSASAAGVKKEKVGRNEPCPCGSGKKYKKCCGA